MSFAAADLPHVDPNNPGVQAAVILDDFSALAFGYEWSTLPLQSHRWKQQLEESRVDLLFVESAWAGNGGSWRGKIAGAGGPSEIFQELLEFCERRGIPTVFWNKEDPPHYEDFLPAAKLFDYVYTSDAGRIPFYERDLGHGRVSVLPFAAQPAIHNPVRPRHGWHSRDVAFAGMYFSHKYPERRAQMDTILGGALDASPRLPIGLEIFSRQLGGDSEYQFPKPLDSSVVGSLTYQQMLSAYKAYKVFLNVNSVVDSESMCARRIFEISAAGTPVISGPSAAIAKFFTNDEVVVAHTRAEASQLTRALVQNEELNDRTVHLAQRKIWKSHTYRHRANALVEDVLPHLATTAGRPPVSMLVSTNRPAQLEHIFRTAAAQKDIEGQLVVLAHGFEVPTTKVRDLKAIYGLENVVVSHAGKDVALGECLNLCARAADGQILTKMDDDDHYGPNYLSDQLFAMNYSRADIVGKQAHYMYLEASNATILRFAAKEHRFTNFVMGPTIMARREAFMINPFPPLGTGEDTGFLRSAVAEGMSIYSADRFNFFQARSGSGHTWQVSDAELLATGDLKFYGRPHEHIDI